MDALFKTIPKMSDTEITVLKDDNALVVKEAERKALSKTIDES